MKAPTLLHKTCDSKVNINLVLFKVPFVSNLKKVQSFICNHYGMINGRGLFKNVKNHIIDRIEI